MEDYVYIKAANIIYNRNKKKWFMLITISSNRLTVTISQSVDSELSAIILRQIRFNLNSLKNTQQNIQLPIENDIKIEGIIFIAYVPPMYKCENNIRLDTVEGYYNPYINKGSLNYYIYDKIRSIMRYRIFSMDQKNQHLYKIPKRKSIQKQLLEFYYKLIFDNDDYGVPTVLNENQADNSFLKYLDFAENVIERFSVKHSSHRLYP